MKTKNIFFALFFIPFLLFAQDKHLMIEDGVLGYYKGLYPERIQGLQWLSDKDQYVYLENNSIWIKDIKKATSQHLELTDFNSIYPALKRIPNFEKISSSDITFQNGNAFEVFDYLNKKSIAHIAFDEKAENLDFCSESKSVAFTIDNNLYVADAAHDKIAVTTYEDENIVSGQAIHRSEFGITKGTFWSPKGNYLGFYQKDETAVAQYPLVDITTYPASLNNIKYPMAGQSSEIAKVGIYHVKSQKLIYLDIDTSDEHYLTNFGWSPDEKYVTLAEVNRAQDHMWFNVYEVTTGKKIKTVFEEKNDKWVEPETPALFLPESQTSFLWLSERDGFMNVYQYDLFNPQTKQLTDFDFVVTQILGFTADGKCLFVEATGEDAKGLQVYKIYLKNGKFTKVTPDEGTYYTQLSPSGSHLISVYTSIKEPRKTGIIDLEKDTYKSLLESKNPLDTYQLGNTEFVKLTAEDGNTLEAVKILPAHFDAMKKYPVLIYVYGGPHAQLVTNTWMGGTNLWMQYLAAEEDYIVFILDGRGSANRGFAFESVIHRNQGVVAMKDQMVGVGYLTSLPYVDKDRIAVHGWSYGGFMTISLLLNYPDVFTSGVAGGPVTDWKYYEVMYGERYMDTPAENPEGYIATRVHDKISNLQADLLIIHGSIDDVVVPQNSMTLLKDAVEKDVAIDFFTYPMHPHNVGGRDRVHLIKKMIHYILDKNQKE